MLGASCGLMTVSLFYVVRIRKIHADADETPKKKTIVRLMIKICKLSSLRNHRQDKKADYKFDITSKAEELTQVRFYLWKNRNMLLTGF